MEMECTGKCGKQWDGRSLPSRGYRWGEGDHIAGWVCEECWGKGVRTAGHDTMNKDKQPAK